MIWDFIRDFFVQYIFGGYCSDGNFYQGIVGFFADKDGNSVYEDTGTYFVSVGGYVEDLGSYDSVYITIGDWLSTTATIIVMCLIVFLLICLVRWVFRAVSSAMLLK